MKRFATILAIQFVVIFAAAFLGVWAFKHFAAQSSNASQPSTHDEVSWFRSALGLEGTQATKLEQLHQDFEAQQSKLCEQHCAARMELAELIRKGTAVTPQ